MDTTPKLLQKSDDDLKKDLLEILEAYRRYKNNAQGAIYLLDCDLANTSTINNSWLSHEMLGLPLEGHIEAVRVFLHCLVDELRPKKEEPNYYRADWRRYSSIYDYYLCGKTAEKTTAEWGSNASQRVDYGERALDEMTKTLRVWLGSPKKSEKQIVKFSYDTLSLPLQKSLICLAILKAPLPERTLPKFLHEMAVGLTEKKWVEVLYESRLVYKNESGDVCLHNETIQYLAAKTDIEQVLPLRVHHWAGKYFRNQGDFLSGAAHFFQAQGYLEAVQTLERYYEHIVGAGLAKDFVDLVRAIQKTKDLEIDLQARISFLLGRLVLLDGDKEEALDYFTSATQCSIPDIRVRSFWQAAKIAEDIRPAFAATYYELAYREAQYKYHDYEMLFLILVDWAWLLMEQQPDIEKAEHHLNQAEKILEAHFPHNHERCSQLYDAMARLTEHYKEGNLEEYVRLTRTAYILAKASGNVERLIHACINLGMGLAHNKVPTEGLEYAEEALLLSEKLGNQETAARSYKVIGACYYFLENYEQAVTSYDQALRMFGKVDQSNERESGWLALTHADMAEALAMSGHKERARFHYLKARKINDLLHDQGAEDFLQQLEEQFPWLVVVLDDKAWQVYDVIEERTGWVSVREMEADLRVHKTPMPRRTINYKLDDLLKIGLIKHNGKKGPASAYCVTNCDEET